MASTPESDQPGSSVPPTDHSGLTPFDTVNPPQNTPTPGSQGPPPNPGVLLAPGARPLPEYELVSLLGRGGFGEVWKAVGPGGFRVALKFVRLEERAGEVEMRSLELMKDIQHAHLLPIFGAWQRDRYLIIAMELAAGTLRDRLNAACAAGLPGIPRGELLEQMRDAARGIDYLNEHRHPGVDGGLVGIQHKDIKPQNLLLVGGTVKVGDFGLAKILQHSITAASSGLTPAYAPPEFLKGQTTRWSDQYSLAVSYCQLRGGRLPFAGSLFEVLEKHKSAPPDLTMLPPDERPAVAYALAKEPSARWPTCRAFIEALTNGTAAPLSPDLLETQPTNRQYERAAPPPTPQEASRRRWRVRMLAGAGLLAMLVVAAILPRIMRDWVIDEVPAPRGNRGSKSAPPLAVAPFDSAKAKELQQAWAEYLGCPVEEEVDLRDGVKMMLVLIPPGTFTMGSPDDDAQAPANEKPQREKAITQPFFLAKFEVTVGQFRQFVRATSYQMDAETDDKGGSGFDIKPRLNEQKPEYIWNNPGFEQTDEHPVVNVSWRDALAFCAWLNTKGTRKYGLPSEAQWEYCCRAGTTTRFVSGQEAKSLTDVANIANASLKREAPKFIGAVSWNDGYPFTAPVGKFQPNPWGLYDMHGNVWEWCQDCYDADYYKISPREDPPGPELSLGAVHILRGGAWRYSPGGCRAAYRLQRALSSRGNSLGFRLLRAPRVALRAIE